MRVNFNNMVAVVLTIVSMISILVWQASAQQEEASAVQLTWSVVGSGGTTTSGGGYVLGSTVGQAGGSAMSGGGYAMEGGFWAGVPSPGEPPLERVLLPFVIRP